MVLSTTTLAAALADLIEEAEGAGREAAGFHEEAHYQAGLWAWARGVEPALTPVAEAKYDDERWEERCDLMLHRLGTPAAWIELKRVWGWQPGSDKRWNTKPSEQLRYFLWDLARLEEQTSRDGTKGFFAAVVFTSVNARFDEEVVPSSAHGSPEACRRALTAWLATEDAEGYELADPKTQDRMWAESWSEVREVFGLPDRVKGKQLLAQMARCLRVLGEADVLPVPTASERGRPVPELELKYHAVVGRLR